MKTQSRGRVGGKGEMKCLPFKDILTFGATGKAELSEGRADRTKLSRKFVGTLVRYRMNGLQGY